MSHRHRPGTALSNVRSRAADSLESYASWARSAPATAAGVTCALTVRLSHGRIGPAGASVLVATTAVAVWAVVAADMLPKAWAADAAARALRPRV